MVLLRALHVAALCVGFGTLLARRLLVPDTQRLAGMAKAALAAGLATLLAWAVLQSAVIADVDTVADLPGAIAIVVTQTWLGHVVLARAALLAVAWLLCGAGLSTAALLPAALALASEAAIGHVINGESVILAAEALHLLAAGAWLGSLPALLVLLGGPDALLAARRFAVLGLAAVTVIAGSALVLASAQLGGLGGLFGTAYGAVILLKLGLFIALLALAAINRLFLTPRLATGSAGMLRLTVTVEIGLGFCVLAAAAWLASLMPAAYQQPVWPYVWRPSLVILQAAREAPEFIIEPVLAIAALVFAWASLAIAPWLGWLRGAKQGLTALAAVILVTVAALPHLSVLLVPAYPTSFYRSTSNGDPSDIAAGQALYATHCATCHGPDRRGDGPLARSQPVPPADLTAEHLLEHDDGELFWWLSHGIDRASGRNGEPRQAMPGFGALLDEPAIWQLIAFIRASNPYYAAFAHNRTDSGTPHVHSH